MQRYITNNNQYNFNNIGHNIVLIQFLWSESPHRRDNSIRITGTPPCVGRWSMRSTCRMSRHRSTRPRLPSREGPSPPAPLGTPAEPESLCHDYPHKGDH